MCELSALPALCSKPKFQQLGITQVPYVHLLVPRQQSLVDTCLPDTLQEVWHEQSVISGLQNAAVQGTVCRTCTEPCSCLPVGQDGGKQQNTFLLSCTSQQTWIPLVITCLRATHTA